MKYMQSPTLPRRMMAVRSGTSRRRSMWVISVIDDGSSDWKNGTLLTRSQVWMKLRRRVSAAKPVARMPVDRPKLTMPKTMATPPTRCPSCVIGTLSPYPVVVSVTTAHHSASGSELKAHGCTRRSMTYMAAEDRNSTIRNSANTLAKGLASSTKTRLSWAKPGESWASLSTQNDAKSHALGPLTPSSSANGTATTLMRSTKNEKERKCSLARLARTAVRTRTALSTAK